MVDIITAINQRHSVRSYQQQPLTSEQINTLQTLIDRCNTDGQLHIQLVTNEPRAFQGLAAYGKFTGVTNYIIIAGKPEENIDERVGYHGERIVLLAQQLGLNTCWVGLTYKKIRSAYTLNTGEKVLCAIAIGYGTTQGRTHKIKTPQAVSNITADSPEWFRKGVESALQAPTAINQQKFYFQYNEPTQPGKLPTVKATRQFSIVGYTQMDLGIAKLHFELAADKNNFNWEE